MKKHLIAAGAVSFFLTACGGGGDEGPTASTLTFPVLAGHKAEVQSTHSDNYSITGTCSGTARVVKGAPTGATFEGKQAVSSNSSLDITLSNCTPSQVSATQTNYYDPTTFALVGVVVPGSDYDVTDAPVTPYPATAKVGDKGTLATMTSYSSSSKTGPTGQLLITYSIEADTATTAMLVLTYTYSGRSTGKQIAKSRIAQDGTLTPVSLETTIGSTTLVMTKV